MLSEMINELLIVYPKMRFQVIVGDTALLAEALRGRQLDVAFTRQVDRDAGPDLETEVLFHDPLAVVAGTSNPWTRRRKVSLSELVDEPWVLPPADTVLGRFGAEISQVRGPEPPRASIVTPSLQLRVSLMSSGPQLRLLPIAMLRFPRDHAIAQIPGAITRDRAARWSDDNQGAQHKPETEHFSRASQEDHKPHQGRPKEPSSRCVETANVDDARPPP